jgi:hypothetical protein
MSRSNNIGMPPRARRWSQVAAATAVAAVAAWAYWVRPAAFYLPEATRGQIRGWNAMNLVELGWAVSPAMLALAVLGFVLLLLEPDRRRRNAVLAMLAFLVLLGLWNRQIIPQLPWAYRRWLPAVLPAVCLFGGYALAALWKGASRLGSRPSSIAASAATWVARGVLVLVAGAIVAHQVSWNAAYRSHRELAGTSAVLDELSELFEPDALVIFEPRTRRGLDRFVAALAIDRGYEVLQLRGPTMDPTSLRRTVMRRARSEQPTYLVTTGYVNAPWPVNGERVHTVEFATRRLRPLSSIVMARQGMELGPPLEVEELKIQAQVYRLEVDAVLPDLFAELDVGAAHDLQYLEGSRFQDVERDGTRDFRWTTGTASMLLPGMGAFARELIVRADPGTYRELGTRRMRVLLDELEVGEIDLRFGWRDYRFPIPPSWSPPTGRPPRLTIQVPSFRPRSDIPGLEDPRTLGVKIDKVGWQPVSADVER